jgi:hypothetical protein
MTQGFFAKAVMGFWGGMMTSPSMHGDASWSSDLKAELRLLFQT